MSRYTITHKCGHDEDVQIYGTNMHGERERKAAWYEEQDCLACRASKARSGEDGLAALDGSLKQVAWAGDIRTKVLKDMHKERDAWADKGATEAEIARADKVIGWLKDQTSASWWIDHDDAISAGIACQKELAKQEA